MIVARGRNGVIGADGDLPWRLPGDLADFRRLTLGKPVVMGRRTWDSLPKRPLPGRPNLVVSRDPARVVEGAEAFTSLDAAVARARALAIQTGAEEVMILGGAQIYAALIDQADRLYVTEVDAAPEGDARFPDLDPKAWTELERTAHPADDRNPHARVLRVMARRPQR